ncbi:hypothetical protein H4S02_004540 [Coemansia sp. RSA 2611]|nr:hypothetical protein H4S01_003899 [Coemansia sp. RSA 2610]KAJ2385018.1 hypothetical protein H4S02_004540 [Coemansia sp. RSA 2611]KAJ2730074.1 hypothetical protein H4R23_003389 [Coemansia sp. Cherry 401B]
MFARALVRPAAFSWVGIAVNSAARRVQTPVAAAIGVNLGLLGGLLGEIILRAVPKQRTSHSKKRKRMATKGLKNRQDISPCRGCGRPKLTAHVCLHCYSDIRKKLRGMRREAERE